jgi:hypothetical protein
MVASAACSIMGDLCGKDPWELLLLDVEVRGLAHDAPSAGVAVDDERTVARPCSLSRPGW